MSLGNLGQAKIHSYIFSFALNRRKNREQNEGNKTARGDTLQCLSDRSVSFEAGDHIYYLGMLKDGGI
jgi:hypothetical protein